jgi:hypothetical protein
LPGLRFEPVERKLKRISRSPAWNFAASPSRRPSRARDDGVIGGIGEYRADFPPTERRPRKHGPSGFSGLLKQNRSVVSIDGSPIDRGPVICDDHVEVLL